MIEYSFNLAMTLVPKVGILVVVYMLLVYAKSIFVKKKIFSKKQDKQLSSTLNYGFLFILAIAVITSVFSPSITYKHESYDRQSKVNLIERYTEQPKDDIIVTDRSKQPSLNEEERSKRFDELTDYKSRTQ